MAKVKQEPAVELEAPPKPRENPVEIPVQVVKGAIQPVFTACEANQDYWFYNQGQNVTWLAVVSAGELPVLIEFAPAHPDYDPVGYEVFSGVTEIGPFAAAIYNDVQFNRATFTVSGPVHVACKRLGV